MYLLDTNHCSLILQGDSDLLAQLQGKTNLIVAISTIVAGELLFMAQKSEQKINNLTQIRAFLAKIKIYSINLEISEIYGDFKAELINQFGAKEKAKRRKMRIEELGFTDHDVWIASTAIYYSLIVVSCDSDFQRMQRVKNFGLESWI
jgi:tRNA(fMet)-specific endonuclease VapC